ncbi:MAG: rod shape-determining protein [Thermomicrobiales bacterium]
MQLVKTAMEETPPELLTEIMVNGITLAGGGAMLLGLDRRLQNEPASRCIAPPIRSTAWRIGNWQGC